MTIKIFTIQKRVPVAKSAYCSIVDRTLKIRHTRTMRKLYRDKIHLVSQTVYEKITTTNIVRGKH